MPGKKKIFSCVIIASTIGAIICGVALFVLGIFAIANSNCADTQSDPCRVYDNAIIAVIIAGSLTGLFAILAITSCICASINFGICCRRKYIINDGPQANANANL